MQNKNENIKCDVCESGTKPAKKVERIVLNETEIIF